MREKKTSFLVSLLDAERVDILYCICSMCCSSSSAAAAALLTAYWLADMV